MNHPLDIDGLSQRKVSNLLGALDFFQASLILASLVISQLSKLSIMIVGIYWPLLATTNHDLDIINDNQLVDIAGLLIYGSNHHEPLPQLFPAISYHKSFINRS